jgi:hypothetical protein
LESQLAPIGEGVTRSKPSESGGIWHKWWLWTAVGAAVIATTGYVVLRDDEPSELRLIAPKR